MYLKNTRTSNWETIKNIEDINTAIYNKNINDESIV